MNAPIRSCLLAAAGGFSFLVSSPAVSGQALTCAAPDNGTGTIDFPAPCPYGTKGSGGSVLLAFQSSLIFQGLPPGEPVVREVTLPPGGIYNRGAGGNLGGEIVTWSNKLDIKMVHPLNGAVLVRSLPMTAEIHVAPKNPGAAEQHFDTEMVSLSAQLSGDPDFTSIRVTQTNGGGGSHGGQGATTLRQTATGDFNVDSFFDITYQIDFEGAGPDWNGVSASGTLAVRMQQTLRSFGAFLYDPVGDATTVHRGDHLIVSNIGSSGLDGVRFSISDENGFGHDLDTGNVHFNPLATAGVPDSGDTISLSSFPPPNHVDGQGISPEFTLSNTGGTVTGVCDWGDVGATTTVVSVWDDSDLLLAVAEVPNGAACFTCPAFDNLLRLGAGRDNGQVCGSTNHFCTPTPGFSMELATPIEITLPGAAGPVSGSTVRAFAVDVRNPPRGLSGMTIRGNGHQEGWNVLRVDGSLRVAPNFTGLGESLFTTSKGQLVVSNIGSSGCDGVSIDLGEGDDDGLPLHLDLQPLTLGGGGGGGRIAIVTRASDGSGLGSVEYGRSGAGSGGSVWVNFDDNGSAVCRVQVFNRGALVGETDLAVSGLTEVARVASGTSGEALLDGCGKLWNGVPWQFPCLVLSFDRPAEFTPTGATPLVGDEIRLLATQATPGALDDVRFFEVLGTDLDSFTICGGSFGPSPGCEPMLLTQHQFEIYDYPGEYAQLHQFRPIALDGQPPGAVVPGALETAISLHSLRLVSNVRGTKTYDATLRLDMTGVGDRAGYQRVLDVPGTLVVFEGTNLFPGEDVQQFSAQIRSMQFVLPQGDPDFASLVLRGGDDFGLPSPGTCTLQRLDGGHFQVDSFFDIAYRIDFQGGQGGPLAGLGGQDSNQRSFRLTNRGSFLLGGRVRATGGTFVDEATGRLRVSNIGSSGCDGVSIALPDVEGLTAEFDPVNPLTLNPGGSLTFEEYGKLRGGPAGASLGTASCTNNGGNFFDVSYDFSSSSPTGTVIQVLDKGRIVEVVPIADAGADFTVSDPAGIGPSPIKSCGKLPGLGAPPCKFIKFCFPGTVRIPNHPDLTGDEVRMLALGVGVETISTFDLRLADTNDPVLLDFAMTKFGRQLKGHGDSFFICDTNNDRVLRISNIGSSGDDGVTMTPPPSPASGLRSSRHPQMFSTAARANPIPLGASVALEATGTIAGIPGTVYGTLHLHGGDGEVEVSGDFGGRGGGTIRLRIYEPSGTAGENPLYEGTLASETNGTSGRPLCYLKYKLDRAFIKSWSAIPGGGGDPCGYTCVLGPDVEVELADRSLTIPNAARIEVAILDPDAPSEDLDSLSLRLANMKEFWIDGVVTAPVHARGLPTLSENSAQIETNSSGQLVVSNIGSSGEDGVSIDLGLADGAVVEPVAPVPLPEGSVLTAGWRDHGTTGSFQTEIVSMSLTGMAPNGGGGGGGRVRVDKFNVRQEFGPVQQQSRVMGFDSNGNLTGDIVVDTPFLGEISTSGPPQVTRLSVMPEEFHHEAKVMGRSLVLDLDGTGTFDPNGGASFPFSRLRVSNVCPPDRPFRCHDGTCRRAATFCPEIDQCMVVRTNIDPLVLDRIGLIELGQVADAVDGARLHVTGDALTVSNIGSSGCDGVSINLNGGGDVFPDRGALDRADFTMKPIRLELSVAAPAGSDIPTLELEAFQPDQSSMGTAEIEFVEVAGGDHGAALHADFSPLGTGEVSVQVCQNGQCIDEYVAPAGEVGRILRFGADDPSLLSTGVEASSQIPGGELPPGYCFHFDRSVTILPPGGDPTTDGITGNGVCIRAHRTLVTVQTLHRLHVMGTHLGEFSLTGMLQNDFGSFLLTHFTSAEIDTLVAADFDIDHDRDGTNAIQEFARGTLPTRWDPAEYSPSSSIATGGDGLPHLRWSYVLAPVTGVEVRMRSSEDLQNFNEDQSQWTLVRREALSEGRTRFTYEMVEPVGGVQGDKKHKHHGHVTILK